MALSAEELFARGRADLNAGRAAAARRKLTQVAARTEDPDLGARAAGLLAALMSRHGEPQAAEALCLEALARPGLSVKTKAMLEGKLGLFALEHGDFALAISRYDSALAGIGDDLEERPSMLINRGVALMRSGRYAAARADDEEAARYYAERGDDVPLAMAVHNGGYTALLEGDLVQALESMSEARTVMERASAVNAAIGELDRAEVLRDAGLATEAEQALERIVGVFGANRMPQARAEAELHLARSLLSHDPTRAARVASDAARRFRRLASEGWAVRADAIRIRAQLAVDVLTDPYLGRPAQAAKGMPGRAEVHETVTSLRAHGMRADSAALDFSARLRPAFDDGAPVRAPRDSPIDVRLLAHRVRVRRSLSAGRQAQARRQAARAVDELARWQSAFASLDLQSAVTMHGIPLMAAAIASAVGSGRPELVFEWAERARHFMLRTRPVRPTQDADASADLAELRALRSEAGSADWLASPRAAELYQRLRQRQWSGTAAGGSEDQVAMGELQAALDDETAVLSYVWSAERVACVVVTARDARLVSIRDWPGMRALHSGLRADLDMAASIVAGPMASVVHATLESRLVGISRELVDPVLADVDAKRIVITAPAVLNGMTWSMLPALRDRVVTVAASATQWLRHRDEVYDNHLPGFALGPLVARGHEELQRAAAAWDAPTLLADTGATVDAVTRLASEVDVLHVAAHGRHAAENPLFSGLELTDGVLFGYDIDRVAAVPPVVVLSACEVGRSSVRWGEEAIGMTRVWLHAGTACVIAAPVVVADEVACELLGEMHVGLAAGEAPAVALAGAARRTGIVAPFQAHGAGF
ncbi:CHAT domain-containing protein [Microbacter sp. GSS18]|nr:CHAT domain-containing protein [Microbacter sp. GSS18]